MTGIMVLGSGVCVQAADKQEINIAWCDDTLDATRSKMIEACEARVEAINAERDDIEVNLTYYDAQASVDQQIANVETAALKNPDVFVFSCVDSQGSLPCLQTMKDTGASIIDIRDMVPILLMLFSMDQMRKHIKRQQQTGSKIIWKRILM